MSKANQKWNGGDNTPKNFSAKVPEQPKPKGIAGQTNGSSRGKQGKG